MPPSAKRRPPDRQDEIVRYFRNRIFDGRLRPGDCLPDRMAIKEQFHVSYLTVQRAFNRMIACGFVDSIPSKGTFVSERQPHLRRFALVFPPLPTKDAGFQNRFYEALIAAASIISDGNTTFEVYKNVDNRESREDYPRLLRDVEHKSLAGMIFPFDPWPLMETPVLSSGIPYAAVMSGREKPDCLADGRHGFSLFMKTAVGHLADAGCRKIACLAHIGLDASNLAIMLRNELESRELQFKEEWLQAGTIGMAEWNRRLIRILFPESRASNPDGLIILDDNVAWSVFGEIVRMGIKVPGKLKIVSHCNYPFDDKPPFPVDFLGYDIVRMLSDCVERLRNPPGRKDRIVKREGELFMRRIGSYENI